MLINLTPHPIRVYRNDTPDRITDLDEGLLFEVPPADKPARIAMIDLGHESNVYGDDSINGPSTWCDWQQFGQCHDLPQPQSGTRYIVALVVARDQTGRSDLIFPVSEVRNERGTVVGCRGFGRVC
jgi:hypothetical protein